MPYGRPKNALSVEPTPEVILVDDAGILELREPDKVAGLEAITEIARELRDVTRTRDLAIVFPASLTARFSSSAAKST